MSKKFVSTVIAVVLGVAVFAMISSAVSLVFEAITIRDLVNITEIPEEMTKTISYMRNTAIAISVFSVPVLASYCFACLSKSKKIFNCIAAGLSLALIAFCLAFVFELRHIALATASETVYTAVISYFGEIITVAVAALIPCAYFTVAAVKAFTAKDNGIEVKEGENDETL